VIAELLRPFMPGTSDRTLAMLGVEPAADAWTTLTRTLTPGTRMGAQRRFSPY
jgi:methionyl-tRNA synthetase